MDEKHNPLTGIHEYYDIIIGENIGTEESLMGAFDVLTSSASKLALGKKLGNMLLKRHLDQEGQGDMI